MKPRAARSLAESHSSEVLRQASEALHDEREPAIAIEGDDPGEQLTHVLLAIRIRERLDQGHALNEAFREVMSEVRGVLSNPSEP